MKEQIYDMMYLMFKEFILHHTIVYYKNLLFTIITFNDLGLHIKGPCFTCTSISLVMK
jgi:hypothetical protein